MRHHRPHPHGDRSNRGSAGPDCSGPHGIIRGWLRRLAARRKAGAVLALGVVILSIPPLLADPLDSWQVRSPSPAGQYYFYGDGQWIGLYGEGGRGSGGIIHSADAVSWSDSSIPPDLYPYGAAYANGLWVAYGVEIAARRFGAMLTSTDGKVWEKQTSGLDLFRSLGVDFAPVGAAYGDGLWMVMGKQGQYLTSPDGVRWTPGGFHAGSIQSGGDIASISYGNGRWLALSNTERASYASTNGTDWTKHPLPEEIVEIRRAQFGGGQWTAISNFSQLLITSTNGIDWETRVISGSGRYSQIAFNDGRWLVAGGAPKDPETGAARLAILTSTDGSTWEESLVPALAVREEIHVESLCHGDGVWLLTGVDPSGLREVLASTNGLDWASRVERVTDGYLRDLEHGAGRWTAVGDPFDHVEKNPDFVIATSFDGRHWTKGSATGSGSLGSVAYGDGRWITTGIRYNAPLPYSGVILTSTNGSEWSSTLEGPPESNFAGSAYGNGLWVAVGSNRSGPVLVTSSDGLTWTPRSLPVATGWWLERVKFASGRWMAFGQRPNAAGQTDRFILTSTDGITWLKATGLLSEASDFHFGDGMWIALTDRMHPDGFRRPTTLRSANGTDWTMRDLGVEFTGDSSLTSIIHVAGRWMIKGNNSRLWSSVDGEEWTDHLTGYAGGSLRSDGRRVLLFSRFDGVTLYASGRLTPARPPSVSIVREGPEIALWIGGEIGERYEIEQSLDLNAADWALLQEITLATDPQRVGIDLQVGNRGFWRARGPAN